MSRRIGASIVIGIVAAGALGCTRAPDMNAVSQGNTTGAVFSMPASYDESRQPFSPSSAELETEGHPANRIATAACERKLECDAIGDGRQHASQWACLTSTRRSAHDALDRLSCENGLDDARLSECVEAVRGAECTSLDALASLEPCSRARLCGGT